MPNKQYLPTIVTSPIGRMMYLVSMEQTAKFLNRVIVCAGGNDRSFLSKDFVKSLASSQMVIPDGYLKGWCIRMVESDENFDSIIEYMLHDSFSIHQTPNTNHQTQNTKQITTNTLHLTPKVNSTVELSVEPTVELSVEPTVEINRIYSKDDFDNLFYRD